MTKEAVLSSLKELPETFPVEELIERLIFLQRVEEGIQQSKNGEVVSLEEARKRLAKWLQ